MQILLRDDDVNYFTSPDELEQVYAPIRDFGPASLGIVPFQTGCKSGAVPPRFRASDATYPIGENEELVEYIRSHIADGNVRIMLHGYSHEDFDKGWEFEACPDPRQRVREGKKYLEDVFDTEITTFVPPHNSLSRRCAKAVVDEGLDILTAFGHWPWERPITLRNVVNFARLASFRLRHGKRRRYYHPLRFESHHEHASYSLIEDTPISEVDEGLKFTYENDGSACIAYHYWELLDTDLLNDFQQLIDTWIRRTDVKFVTDEELFE